MTYETNISLSKPFDIDDYKSCIYSIFINETNRLKTDKFNLRFKRVANFSKFKPKIFWKEAAAQTGSQDGIDLPSDSRCVDPLKNCASYPMISTRRR